MKCKFIKELISPYIDGELERPDILRVEKHVEVCENCKKILSDYQKISFDIHRIEIPKPSEKVLKRISLIPRRRVFFRRLIFSTSLLVVLGALLIPFLQSNEKATPESPKQYYILKEEKTPYTEVCYEREGNFVLTSYSGGSF